MNEEIRKAIKTITKDDKEVFGTRCTVKSVNLTKNTCYCLPLDTSKADLVNVQLIADEQTGFLLIPAVNSIVTVEYLSNEQYYVSQFSKLQLIKLNGDANGGLIKVDDWLQSYNTQITTLKTAITAALTSIDASIVALGGASVSSPAFTAATASITNVLANTITNTTVKHGNG